MKKALTKTQLAVLREMHAGSVLHVLRGISSNCFLSKQMKSVRWGTMNALKHAGLIEDHEKENMRWRGSKYLLSEAGRALLAKESQ